VKIDTVTVHRNDVPMSFPAAQLRLAMLTILLVALTACVHQPATTGAGKAPTITSSSVERLTEAGYRVSWQARKPGEKVDVYLASSTALDAPTRRVAHAVRNGSVDVTVPVTPRPYFLLRTQGGDTWVAERLLPLAGGQNFRDLGGYRTTDGRQVRWGVLYRSGSMVGLTNADEQYLATLGIRVLCDLRSPPERQAEPTPWQAFGVQDYLAWDYQLDMTGIGAALQDRAPTGEKMAAAMTQFYRALPKEFAPRYRDMFARLAAGEEPLALNCSAGKDRTGLGSALLLLSLGVPRDTVMQDYLLSQQTYDPSRARQSAAYKQLMAHLAPEVIGALTGVRAEYLDAAFAQIEQDYGSVDAYLATALGVTPEIRARLQQRLLR
jgi:protein-tyrosine phosphatase